MTATINIQKLWDQKYRDESVPFPIDGDASSASVTPSGGDDWTNLQSALNAGGRVYLSGQYQISKPLEWTNRLAWIDTAQDRNTQINCHSSWSATDHQMIRNWSDADWTLGETNHRVAPLNRTTFPFADPHHYYPRLLGELFLSPNGKSNVACFSWATPNEGAVLTGLRPIGGSDTDTNLGTWGIDIQGTINGLKGADLIFYGYGFERQLSIDCSAASGQDVFFENVTFSPNRLFHSRCYVVNLDNFSLENWHTETAGGSDAGAHGYFYLRSLTGFGSYSITDGSVTRNASTAVPFLRHVSDNPDHSDLSPPLLHRVKVNKTAGTWTGNLIEDLWNSIPLTGSIGSLAADIEVIHSYDGQSLVWSNSDSTLGTHYFKTPDIPGVTDVSLNTHYLVGSASNYQGYTTPDAAAFDLTTGCDLRILMNPTSWTQNADLFGKWFGATDTSYLFQLITGSLQFAYSTTGSNSFTIISTATVSASTPLWARVVVDATGGGVTTATFYTSPDGTTWTQLGAAQTDTVGPFHSGASPVEVGMQTGSGTFTGKIYRAEIRNLAGTLIGEYDARALSQGANYTDSGGHVWTPAPAAAISADATLRPGAVFPGTNGQYLTTTGGVSGWGAINVPHVGAATPTGGASGDIKVGTGKIWVNDAGTWKSVAVA